MKEEKRPLVDLGGYRPGRSLVKKNEIRLKPSPIYKGLYVGPIVGPETGCFCATHSLDLHHLPPKVSTGTYRHDDMLLHVLNGNGYSIIDDVRYEWGRGDTIHIKPGSWYQHVNPNTEPANMLAARTTSLLNYVKPFGSPKAVGEGDFVDLGDGEWEHPFGLGKERPIGSPDNPSGSRVQWEKKKRAEIADRLKNARVIMKAKDVHWEYPEHRGELDAMLAYPSLGFDTRLVIMGLQAIPPGGSNETHQHGEAIVYILAGQGNVIVDGETYDIEEGDTVFVHWGQYHQFKAKKDSDSLFIQMRILASEFLRYIMPFPWFEEKESAAISQVDRDYVPKLPW